MSELMALDTTSEIANYELANREPRLDSLVTEIAGAALPFVPDEQRASFMHAASGMLRELQSEAMENDGHLPLDRLGAVAEHYSGGAIFRRAGVTVLPFMTEQGGFVLATTVGQTQSQALVHVAAGANWQDTLTDLSSAGQGQGLDRFDRPRDDEDNFWFQRRALATVERVVDANRDAFRPVAEAVTEGHKGLPWRTAVAFGVPDLGTNAMINVAYARVDGSDIMGWSYDKVAARYGGIEYDSARAIVGYQTGFLMNAVFNSMIPVTGIDKQ
jgi:hypothetical protein